MPAWVQIELDTTPPEITADPVSSIEIGSVYTAEIEFDEILDETSSIYIQQGESVVEFETLELDESNMRAVFDASGLSLGAATLHIASIDDVLNEKLHESPLMVISGDKFLMEVPGRDWFLDLPNRNWDFELPEVDDE